MGGGDRRIITPLQFDRLAAAPPDFHVGLHGGIHLRVAISRHVCYLVALRFLACRSADRGPRVLRFAGLGVIKLGSLAIALQLGQVAHIVHREGIGGIEAIGLFEVAARFLAIVAVHCRDAAQVHHGNLLLMVLAQLVHQLAYFPGIAFGDIADRFAAPVGVAGHHDALLRTRGGGCGVVAQRLVQFAFLLFGKAEVVQRERIAAIDGESLLENHIGFRRARLHQQPHGLHVQSRHPQIAVLRVAGNFAHHAAFIQIVGGAVYGRFRADVGRQPVIALGPLQIAFQLGNVTQIVEGERIVGIDEISAVEQLFGAREIALLDRLHAIAVQLLHRCGLAAFGNGDAQILCGGGNAGQRGQRQHGTEENQGDLLHRSRNLQTVGSTNHAKVQLCLHQNLDGRKRQ